MHYIIPSEQFPVEDLNYKRENNSYKNVAQPVSLTILQKFLEFSKRLGNLVPIYIKTSFTTYDKSLWIGYRNKDKVCCSINRTKWLVLKTKGNACKAFILTLIGISLKCNNLTQIKWLSEQQAKVSSESITRTIKIILIKHLMSLDFYEGQGLPSH